MAVGQQVLAGSWDVLALRAAEDRLEGRAVDAGRVHAALLRDVLAVHTQYCAAGMAVSSQPQVALLLRCSELRAGRLLNDALGLAELPEALAALERGLLTVEQQSSVVVAPRRCCRRPIGCGCGSGCWCGCAGMWSRGRCCRRRGWRSCCAVGWWRRIRTRRESTSTARRRHSRVTTERPSRAGSWSRHLSPSSRDVRCALA